MHSVRIELAKMILVGTRITYQATGDADMFTIYTYQVYEYIYICFNHLRPSILSPSSRNSDPGSHSRLFSPPTHYGSCLPFLYFSSSLVDSRRIVLTHARRSQQFIPSLFCKQIQNLAWRRHSSSRTNTTSRSIRGLPLVHRGYCCIILVRVYNNVLTLTDRYRLLQ